MSDRAKAGRKRGRSEIALSTKARPKKQVDQRESSSNELNEEGVADESIAKYYRSAAGEDHKGRMPISLGSTSE